MSPDGTKSKGASERKDALVRLGELRGCGIVGDVFCAPAWCGVSLGGEGVEQ